MVRTTVQRDRGQTSNLATELLVASQLMRQGFTVTLTLGQTKEIDLIAISPRGTTYNHRCQGAQEQDELAAAPQKG